MMHNYRRELVQIKNLLKQNPEGMSVTDIAKALQKNKNTTGRYLDHPPDFRARGYADVRHGKSFYPVAEGSALGHAQLF